MAFDAHKNFALSLVAVAPSPATSGTALTVTSGEGVLFPAAPFNATIAPPSGLPTSANAEIVRVTARSGDVLTITRAQEGSTARAVQVGDLIAATITVKAVADLESGSNFPQLATPGTVTAAGVVTGAVYAAATVDGADTGALSLMGGGGYGSSRGGNINVFGNEDPRTGGIQFVAGVPGNISFITQDVVRGTVHPSGGLSWGGTPTDPGANNVSVTGTVTAGQLTTAGTVTTNVLVASLIKPAATADGADTGLLYLAGGGATGATRGGYLMLFGNEWAGAPRNGNVELLAGEAGEIVFYTQDIIRGMVQSGGGLSWGTTTDPGPGVFLVSGGGYSGSELQTTIGRGFVVSGTNITTSHAHASFYNPNGGVGSIQTNGTATVYLTTSDQRLKIDRGPLADRTVLQRTRVHAFDWQTDGTSGRGVFAQEAITVAPFAVTEGTDERDEQGRLTHPWGVDYSKYVPDLIAGWQAHDADLAALRARLACLEQAATVTHPVSALRLMGAAIMARVRGWLAPLRPAKV
jgi:hypothetical protein